MVTTLRKLAREYADGSINQEDYRKSRTEFIEGVLAGTAVLEVNEYQAPVKIPTFEEELENTGRRADMKAGAEVHTGDITQFGSAPAANNTSGSKTAKPAVAADTGSKKPVIIGAAIAGVIVVIAIIAMLLPGSEKSSQKTTVTQQSNDNTEKGAATATPVSTKAHRLIRDFLTSKNWSDTSINSFVIQWQALTTEEQAAANGSLELNQLTNAIYKKLLEEQALSGLGDAESAMEKQRKLVSFAEDIGIHDPRIKIN